MASVRASSCGAARGPPTARGDAVQRNAGIRSRFGSTTQYLIASSVREEGVSFEKVRVRTDLLVAHMSISF